MTDASYTRLMATHLEHVVECFEFSKPPYRNENLAKRANELRWDIIKFLEGVETNENSN